MCVSFLHVSGAFTAAAVFQDCPPDAGDFRAQQCSAHADVRFQGQFHEWLPVYNDPENPCALKCKAKGSGLLVELAPKVLDGTRCYTESLDMCISGVCQVGVPGVHIYFFKFYLWKSQECQCLDCGVKRQAQNESRSPNWVAGIKSKPSSSSSSLRGQAGVFIYTLCLHTVHISCFANRCKPQTSTSPSKITPDQTRKADSFLLFMYILNTGIHLRAQKMCRTWSQPAEEATRSQWAHGADITPSAF